MTKLERYRAAVYYWNVQIASDLRFVDFPVNCSEDIFLRKIYAIFM